MRQIVTTFTLLLVAASFPAPSASQPQSRSEAEILPRSAFDVSVVQTEGTSNISVGNDTHLFLSVQIKQLSDLKVLEPHIEPTLSALYGRNVLHPQGGLLTGLYEASQDYAHPSGNNATVTVITPGPESQHIQLSDTEKTINSALFLRTCADQFVLPILSLLAGEFNSEERAWVSQAIFSAIFDQNVRAFDDLREAVNEARLGDVASFAANYILRDVENNGPITRVAAEKGIALDKRIARHYGRRTLAAVIPIINKIEWARFILKAGSNGTIFIKTFDDLRGTPGKLKFDVFFEPGVSGISPRIIRVAGERLRLVVQGHNLRRGEDQDPELWVLDENGRRQFLVNGQFVDGDDGTVEAQVRDVRFRGLTLARLALFVGDARYAIPYSIVVVDQVVVSHLEPRSGHGGQEIAIIGEGFYPYLTSNDVSFRRRGSFRSYRVRPTRVTRQAAFVKVPYGVGAEEGAIWDVVVLESHGSERKESAPLAFTARDGTLREYQAEAREENMPEDTIEFEGTLTPSTQIQRHEFLVRGGMQVLVTLESIRGSRERPRSAGIQEIRLEVESTNAEGERVVEVVETGDITLRAEMSHGELTHPGRVMRHTTGSPIDVARYWVYVSHWYGDEVHYKVKARTIARGDGGWGVDAPATANLAMEVPLGQQFTGYLFGPADVVPGDHDDLLRFSTVPGHLGLAASFWVKAHHYRDNYAAFARMSLWEEIPLPSGRFRYELVSEREQVRFDDFPLVLKHKPKNGRTGVRNYLLWLKHWYGEVEYTLVGTLY